MLHIAHTRGKNCTGHSLAGILVTLMAIQHRRRPPLLSLGRLAGCGSSYLLGVR